MTKAKAKARVKVDYTKRGWVATKAKAKRPRKPRPMVLGRLRTSVGIEDGFRLVRIGGSGLFKPKEARSLADWLVRAASWIESKNEKR